MSRLSLAFFATAVVCALIGMAWGMQMGIVDNFTLAPAHAHLNLVGWTTLALMGAFYALAGDRVSCRLGWINYALSTLGVVVMIPSLAILLSTDNKTNPGIVIGSLLVFAGMAVFLAAVISAARTASRGRA